MEGIVLRNTVPLILFPTKYFVKKPKISDVLGLKGYKHQSCYIFAFYDEKSKKIV